MEDKLIIQALQSEDPYIVNEAFELLYNKYSKLLYFLAVKIVKNNDDATDLVSDVFLACFNKRKSLSQDKNIKYYLTTSIKNSALNFCRKTKPATLSIENLEEEPLDEKVTLTSYEEFLEQFSNVLTEDEINLVVDHLILGETFKEISEKKKTSLFSESSKYNRIMKKLKKYYGKE